MKKEVTIHFTAILIPVKNLSSQLAHREITLILIMGSFWGHSVPSEEFKLTANSLGAHMKVT